MRCQGLLGLGFRWVVVTGLMWYLRFGRLCPGKFHKLISPRCHERMLLAHFTVQGGVQFVGSWTSLLSVYSIA